MYVLNEFSFLSRSSCPVPQFVPLVGSALWHKYSPINFLFISTIISLPTKRSFLLQKKLFVHSTIARLNDWLSIAIGVMVCFQWIASKISSIFYRRPKPFESLLIVHWCSTLPRTDQNNPSNRVLHRIAMKLIRTYL